jgi:hypothetical protein
MYCNTCQPVTVTVDPVNPVNRNLLDRLIVSGQTSPEPTFQSPQPFFFLKTTSSATKTSNTIV